MEGLVGNVRLPLLILLVVVGVVLLIACTNIASLLLVRTTEQSRELAVRSALGAGLGRLVSRLVGEGVALSLMGGLIGSCLAFTLLRPFAALLPAEIPRVTEIGLDHRVLVFGILLSVSTGLFIGLLPAFGAGRDQLSTLLQGAGRRFTGSLRRNRLQTALVVSEIALTFVLLTGAGLLVKSFVRLTSVNPGFASENMLTLYVEPPAAKYDSDVSLRALYLELAERLEAVPGVQAVASSSQMPFADGTMSYAIHIESQPGGETFHIECSNVTASYFQVMSIPIIAGRAFTPEEDWSAAPFIIISQEMAERFWPDGEAIGQRVRMRATDTPSWFTIVGVAGDVHHQGLGVEPHPKFYIPFSSGIDDDQTFAIRTRVNPAGIVGAAQDAIWAMDPDILVAHVSTFDDLISRSIANPRFQTIFLSSFSALSAVIAVVGIFGLLACSVVQRTHEIGIRMALGAGHRNVMFSVLRRGLALAGTGLTIGLVVSLFAVRVLKSYLFEISPTDPPTLVAVTVLFASAAMVASYIPARRATRVDPMLAIKHE
jgi:predicted permease